MREKIATPKAPAAIGPYAQAVRLNDFLFASGQIPVDPETGEIAGDTIESQTRQVMKNIQAILGGHERFRGVQSDLRRNLHPLPGPLLRRRAGDSQGRLV